MMGYLGREDKTREDIDDDGYMHSGDIGALDSDGFMKITGMYQFFDFHMLICKLLFIP